MRYFIIVVLSLLLIGCDAIKKLDQYDEYKKTPEHNKKIALPKDMKKKATANHYVIPKAAHSGHANISVLPPGANISE